MKRLCLLFLLLLGISTASFAGKVYKWTDENGQIHYSTFPPTKANTENVRVPGNTQHSKDKSGARASKKSYKDNRYSRKYQERKKKQAAQAYDRKYGAEARLQRLEEEKHRKKMQAERIYRERIRMREQAEKSKEFEQKWKGFKDKLLGLEGECKAAHGTDCGNPEYLKKWVKKKYAPKK